MNRKELIIALCAGFLFYGSTAASATSGVCRFDTRKLKFADSAQDAARCLLRPVLIRGNLGPVPGTLPPTLGSLIGTAANLPRDRIRAYIRSIGLTERDLGGSLEDGLSKNNAGIAARFFVIHDTSTPNFLKQADFPSDINSTSRVNGLSRYGGANAVAHLFINRRGEVLAGHPLSTGWRATKLETAVVRVPARGLFIHVELIQPRKSDPRGSANNDNVAPNPGFTQAQYEKLALAYLVASVRAKSWLLPAFHAVIDSGISDAHDDPQNFDLAAFDNALDALTKAIDYTSP